MSPGDIIEIFNGPNVSRIYFDPPFPEVEDFNLK